MRNDLIKTIGLLDESFGIGFYEDDDFCIRAKKAGFNLVCREDVFIYHKGNGSFEYYPTKSNKDLMRGNRKKLEQKTGIKYKPVHPRDQILKLILRDLEASEQDNNLSEIHPRIDNRLKQLGTMQPGGLFKRIIFNRKLRAITGKIQGIP